MGSHISSACAQAPKSARPQRSQIQVTPQPPKHWVILILIGSGYQTGSTAGLETDHSSQDQTEGFGCSTPSGILPALGTMFCRGSKSQQCHLKQEPLSACSGVFLVPSSTTPDGCSDTRRLTEVSRSTRELKPRVQGHK